MGRSRRAQWVFGAIVLFSLTIATNAEAGRRRKTRFINLGNPQASFVLTGKRRFFSRSFINELLLVPAFIGLSRQASLRALAAQGLLHGISAPNVLGTDRPVVVDSSSLQPSGSVTNDQGLALSAFCNFQCGAAAGASVVACWVPRDGTLAIVPFSVSGPTLCHARQELCLQIASVGRSPDTLPYICKNRSSDVELVRSEATFSELGDGVATQVFHNGGRCRSGFCGR